MQVLCSPPNNTKSRGQGLSKTGLLWSFINTRTLGSRSACELWYLSHRNLSWCPEWMEWTVKSSKPNQWKLSTSSNKTRFGCITWYLGIDLLYLLPFILSDLEKSSPNQERLKSMEEKIHQYPTLGANTKLSGFTKEAYFLFDLLYNENRF